MAFFAGLGTGFGQEIQRNQEEARKERRQVLLDATKQYKTELKDYKKNKGIRQGKIAIAQSVLDTAGANYSQQDIATAGQATGWKSVDDTVNFLRQNARPLDAGVRQRQLIDESLDAFGPEVQRPEINVPTQEERGLIDIFAPRRFPSMREIEAVSGVAPQQQASTPSRPSPVQTPGFVPEDRRTIGRVSRVGTAEEVNAIQDFLRTESALADVRPPEGLGVDFEPLNSRLRPLRGVASLIAEQNIDRAGGANRAAQEAANSFGRILTSPAFQNLAAQVRARQAGSIDPNTKVIAVRDKDTEQALTEMSSLFDQFNSDPIIFNQLDRSFRQIASDDLVNELVSEADNRFIQTQLSDIATNPEIGPQERERLLSQRLAGLSTVRRNRVLDSIINSRQPQEEATAETVQTETPQTPAPEVTPREFTAPRVEGEAPQAGEPLPLGDILPAPIGEELDPVADTLPRIFERNPRFFREGFADDSIFRRPDPVVLPEGTIQNIQGITIPQVPELARQSVQRIADLTNRVDDIEGTVNRVLPLRGEQIRETLNTLDPASQAVASIYLEEAETRGAQLSDAAKREVLTALQEPVAPDNAVDYIVENENERLTPYTDSEGNKTVGIGFNLDKPGAQEELAEVVGPTRARSFILRGEGELTEEESQRLLATSLGRAEAGAERVVQNFRELPTPAQVVVIDMIYNLGIEGFNNFENMIDNLEAGNIERATEELLSSDYAFQVGSRAIKNAKLLLETR